MAVVGTPDKSYGIKSLPITSGGSSASGNSGPTGSSRSYPKSNSKPSDTDNAPFNPQKVAVTTIYVGGVGS